MDALKSKATTERKEPELAKRRVKRPEPHDASRSVPCPSFDASAKKSCANLNSSSGPGNPDDANCWRQPRSYAKETSGLWNVDVPSGCDVEGNRPSRSTSRAKASTSRDCGSPKDAATASVVFTKGRRCKKPSLSTSAAAPALWGFSSPEGRAAETVKSRKFPLSSHGKSMPHRAHSASSPAEVAMRCWHTGHASGETCTVVGGASTAVALGVDGTDVSGNGEVLTEGAGFSVALAEPCTRRWRLCRAQACELATNRPGTKPVANALQRGCVAAPRLLGEGAACNCRLPVGATGTVGARERALVAPWSANAIGSVGPTS
mmetsp:Transcript_76065/g.211432  ORF Transcript_76065/g.211432 Transcript_76065/m.211432 type:complete len:319 (-) Transcript_76065:54-1010(-)